ncbi:MAG: thiamine diphosphokinase [Clostridia bacterium]
MKALVISGGTMLPLSMAQAYIGNADLILCADSGADHARAYGIVPDIILGDMDSVSEKALDTTAKIFPHPPEKDDTDTKIAVDKAMELGAGQIDIICGTGDRLDHTMANIWLLAYMADRNVSGRVVDARNVILLCRDRLELTGKEGAFVSILPFSDRVEGVTLTGFRYPLKNQSIPRSWTQGVSNEIMGETGVIQVREGTVLVFFSEDSRVL